MFTPPPAWATSVLVPAVDTPASPRWSVKSLSIFAITAILLSFLSAKCYRHAFKNHKHRRLQTSWDRFQPMRAVVVPRTPPKPRSRQAVWEPPSPESSPSPEFTPSSESTPSPQRKPSSSSSTPSQNVPYVAVPSGFPRGPGLVLTRPQLRFAFYFSPKDRRVVDPDAKYWCGGHGTTLRTEFWGLIFDRNFALTQKINGNVCETRFGFPEWVLRSNIGSDWPSKALYFEDPTRYTSKGKLRHPVPSPVPSPAPNPIILARRTMDELHDLLDGRNKKRSQKPNEKKRSRFDDDDYNEWKEIE